jgi:phosphohistidine phosphatase
MLDLHLLRHAKAITDPSLEDRDRPLAPEGRRAAERLAAWVRDEGLRVDLVLCSPARRARETLEPIARALGVGRLEFEEELYQADDAGLCERIRSLPDGVVNVLLVGHNPAIHTLASMLAGSGQDLDALRERFPAGAWATLSFELDAWPGLAPGSGRLTRLVTP